MCSRQRGGTTLVEVLVAIFIMAIGLMTLLTLFPLGALSMAQAIQDSRAGQAAANAAALAEAKQLRHLDIGDYIPRPSGPNNYNRVVYDKDPNAPVGPTTPHDPDPTLAPGIAGYRDIFVDPLPRGNKGAPNKKLPPIPIDSANLDPSFPSYPVFVDPIGYLARLQADNSAPAVGDAELGNTPGIPRRIPRYIWGPEGAPRFTMQQRIQYANRFNALLDDLEFDKDTNAGSPTVIAPTTPRTIARNSRYSWAYLLRRPRAADLSVVDVSVVLYNARPAQAPLPEHVFQNVVFNVGSTQLDVPYSGAKPDIKKGNWVLDATLRQGSRGNYTPEPHGFFYRVVGVTDNGSSLTLELQDPIKPFAKYTQTTEMRFTGTLIFMEYVVEVFEKGSGWKP
jgi:hypothetical protein